MIYTSTICAQCSKTFFKDTKRFNESIKRGWKFFCSKKCEDLSRMKRVKLTCQNPTCNKVFERISHEVNPSKRHFCSQSCANIIIGKQLIKYKICPICKNSFYGRNKFCSWECVKRQIIDANKTYSKEILTKQILHFYEIHKRIPIKKELPQAKTIRRYFGTWNKCIIAAGFEPNTTMFSKRFKALDGHMCDSLSEKVIDDWLFQKQIPHEIHVPYNINKMTADFKINDVWIEFFGLEGRLLSYDKTMLFKRKLWKEKGLKVIEIFPHDLFPKNKLSTILSFCLKS